MAKRRRQGELVRGVFGALIDQPEGLSAADVLKAVEGAVPPTTYELEDYPNRPGVRRFEKTVRFATIGPVKAGWLVKDKGHWTLTDDGRAAYQAFTDPETLEAEWSRLYKAWKRAQPSSTGNDEGDSDLEDAALATFEEAEEGSWAEIRTYLGQMPPYEFQNLVAALLKALGYHVLWVAPPGPDGGIDLIAHNDPLGTSSPRIKVQVKRQIGTRIGREGISSFVGTLGAHDVGIYVSAGGFSREAEREARSQEQRRLTLIDLDRLIELWIEHSPNLEDADRQRLPLKAVYFLSLDE